MKKIFLILAAAVALSSLAAAEKYDLTKAATEEEISVDMVQIPGTDIEMLRTEVTQPLYESVMGVNPSEFKGNDNPVECVSWYDAVYFCNKLSVMHGLTPVYAVDSESDVSKWGYEPNSSTDKDHKFNSIVTQNIDADGYRLPTLDERIYAAKGGQNYIYAGSDIIDEVAWYKDNSGNTTHPVAQKKPNGYGLYDMSGNVYEWVWDAYYDRYRLLGGGAFYNSYLWGTVTECETTGKGNSLPWVCDSSRGFRIVRKAKFAALQGDDEETTKKAYTQHSDFPDELPPVSEERLQEILAEIVEREKLIITEEESDDTVRKMGGSTYIHTKGSTYLIDPNTSSPYLYFRMQGNEKSCIPNSIYVLYARPTQKNMEAYVWHQFAMLLGIIPEEARSLDPDKIDWQRIKSQASLHTTVKIGSEDYDVLFNEFVSKD